MILLLVVILLFITPDQVYALTPEMKTMMKETFGRGGEGFVLTLLVIIGLGGWVFEQVTSLLGLSRFSTWIKVGAVFIGLSIFLSKAFSVLGEILSYVI